MFRLGRVDIQGAASPAARDAVALSPGRDAVAADIIAARERLVSALRDEGHPFARVAMPPAVLHPDTQRLEVVLIAEPGPRARIGEISMSGLVDVNETFLRERLLLHEGALFDPRELDAARRDLMGLDVFSVVRMMPADALDQTGRLPIRIDFAERKRHVLDLGASYSTDLGAGLTAAWRHRNLFGNAEQLHLSAAFRFGGTAISKPSYEVGARFVKPGFLVRDQSLELGVTALKQSLQAYDQTGVIEKATIIRKPSAHWTISLGLLGEQEQITQEGSRNSYNLIGLPMTVKYDSTTNAFNPTQGLRALLSVTPMQSLGPHEATFVLTQASASAYFDLVGQGRGVVAVRGLVGIASGVGVSGLPPDQRFYAGGSSTVRGYRYQSVGPRFPSGNPTGGTAVSAGSVELRQHLFGDFGMAAFVDGGQVGTTGNPFSNAWQFGSGLGVRYNTAIGPIRLDVAVPLQRRSADDRFEIYVGIGQAF